MKRCMLVGVSVVAAALSILPATLQSQALERSLYVTMLDASGAPVPNLGPADFIVREDNVAREVLRVVPAGEPMQVAILVDTSSAASQQIAHIRRALPPFVDAMTMPTPSGRRNEVALITLGSRPTILADYSLEPGPLHKAIERIWEESVPGGYYLLDGIIEVSQGFRRREATRPVIVAIVTEGPELSNRHPDQVISALRDAAAAFHVITLGSQVVGVDDDTRDRNTVVDQGPRVSGGTHTNLLTGSALTGKLEQLANVLTHTYRVTYGRPDSLIPPDRVTVTARRADVTAHGTPVRESQARQ
jgi:hypothetical protein